MEYSHIKILSVKKVDWKNLENNKDTLLGRKSLL